MTDWCSEPTERGDEVAYAMRDYYEANRPLRWWEKRNPPGSWGCIADELMLGLRNIVLNAEREYREQVATRSEHALPPVTNGETK